MVGAVLGVVLDDEDRGVLPEARVRDGLDDLADGQVVAGDTGRWRVDTRAQAVGVIFRQRHHHKAWPHARLLRLLQVLDEEAGPQRVAVGPSQRSVSGVAVTAQRALAG